MLDPRAAEDREHCRGVGGRDDGAHEERLRPAEAERARPERQHRGGAGDADGREHRRGRDHPPQAREVGVEAAVEQDQDERDRADRKVRCVVLERDVVRAPPTRRASRRAGTGARPAGRAGPRRATRPRSPRAAPRRRRGAKAVGSGSVGTAREPTGGAADSRVRRWGPPPLMTSESASGAAGAAERADPRTPGDPRTVRRARGTAARPELAERRLGDRAEARRARPRGGGMRAGREPAVGVDPRLASDERTGPERRGRAGVRARARPRSGGGRWRRSRTACIVGRRARGADRGVPAGDRLGGAAERGGEEPGAARLQVVQLHPVDAERGGEPHDVRELVRRSPAATVTWNESPQRRAPRPSVRVPRGDERAHVLAAASSERPGITAAAVAAVAPFQEIFTSDATGTSRAGPGRGAAAGERAVRGDVQRERALGAQVHEPVEASPEERLAHRGRDHLPERRPTPLVEHAQRERGIDPPGRVRSPRCAPRARRAALAHGAGEIAVVRVRDEREPPGPAPIRARGAEPGRGGSGSVR